MPEVNVLTSYLRPGEGIDGSDVTIPLRDLKRNIEQVLDGPHEFRRTNMTARFASTVISGSVTAFRTMMQITITGSAADLETIVHNSLSTDFLIINGPTSGKVITIKHGVGNIRTESGRDIVLNNNNSRVALAFWNNEQSVWFIPNDDRGSLWLRGAESLTINADTISPTRTRIALQPQTGTADDLSTIINASDLDMLILNTQDSGDTITVKHGVGNVVLPNGEDVTLTGQEPVLVLVWNDISSQWVGLVSNDAAKAAKTPINSIGAIQTIEQPGKTVGLLVPNSSGPYLPYIARKPRSRFLMDYPVGGTSFAQYGGAHTVVGSLANAAQTDSDYIQITSAASIGSFASVAFTTPSIQLRYSPIFECYFRDWGNTTTGTDPNYSGAVIGLLGSTIPTVTASGTTFAGVSGMFATYQYFDDAPPFDGFQMYFVVLDAGSVMFSQSFGYVFQHGPISRPRISPFPFAFWYDYAATRLYFRMISNNSISSFLFTPSPTLASLSLRPFMGDATRAASAISWKFGGMYAEQKVA